MKWSIVIIMVFIMASSLYGHGGFDNISADSHLVLNYGYNVYVDVYNFFIDIINEVV